MVLWSSLIKVWFKIWVKILGIWQTPTTSSGTEPVSGLTLALLYCCALYNFSLLKFASGNLVLTEF